jgi:hypothetical protein
VPTLPSSTSTPCSGAVRPTGSKNTGPPGLRRWRPSKQEREKLKPLPADRFQVPVWKQVSVHAGDQFLTFDKKRFSLPPAWKGRSVWARWAAPLLQLYYDERLIRQYVLSGSQRIYWVPEDFPAEVREMMHGGYPAWMLKKAREYGQSAVELLVSILQPHAYLNARRARGMLDLMAAHYGRPYFEEACLRARRRCVVLPATFRRMLEAAEQRPVFERALPISTLGTKMVRDVRYYTN